MARYKIWLASVLTGLLLLCALWLLGFDRPWRGLVHYLPCKLPETRDPDLYGHRGHKGANRLGELDDLLTPEQEQRMLAACPRNRCLKVNRSAKFSDFIDDTFRVLNHAVLGGRPIQVLLETYDTVWATHEAIRKGFWAEFGVFQGLTLVATQQKLLKASSRSFQGVLAGFDSFEGLPEKWRPGFDAGAFDVPGAGKSLYDRVREKLMGEVELYKGWFQDTITDFKNKHPRMAANTIHHDADLFLSTMITLTMLNDRIVPGTHMIFDELQGYPGYERHEILALYLWMLENDAEVCAMGVQDTIQPSWKNLTKEVHGFLESAWFQVLSTRTGRAS